MPDDPGTDRQQNPQHGNSREYILSRLEAAGLYDLAKAVRADRVSAFAVACQLGWSARPENIGNGSRNQARQRRHQLDALANDDQKNTRLMELWLGPNPSQGSLFNSREELQTAWETNRAEVMARWGSHGRRPQGWWQLDPEAGNLEYPGYNRERSTLWRANVLTADERAELESGWRREFDAARGKGARARREAFEHHDIPADLVAKWSARKKRPPSLAQRGPSQGRSLKT